MKKCAAVARITFCAYKTRLLSINTRRAVALMRILERHRNGLKTRSPGVLLHLCERVESAMVLKNPADLACA